MIKKVECHIKLYYAHHQTEHSLLGRLQKRNKCLKKLGTPSDGSLIKFTNEDCLTPTLWRHDAVLCCIQIRYH